jgi:hypothetical protein
VSRGPRAVAKCIAGMIVILFTTFEEVSGKFLFNVWQLLLGFYSPYFKTVLEEDLVLLADVSCLSNTSKSAGEIKDTTS